MKIQPFEVWIGASNLREGEETAPNGNTPEDALPNMGLGPSVAGSEIPGSRMEAGWDIDKGVLPRWKHSRIVDRVRVLFDENKSFSR